MIFLFRTGSGQKVDFVFWSGSTTLAEGAQVSEEGLQGRESARGEEDVVHGAAGGAAGAAGAPEAGARGEQNPRPRHFQAELSGPPDLGGVVQ